MQDLIKIPQRFYIDHAERDLDTPEVIRSTKTHFHIRADDPALGELLEDAEHYATPGTFDPFEYGGLISSARATRNAIRKAQRK